MSGASLDTFTLVRGTLSRLLRYVFPFRLLGALAAVLRGLLDLRVEFDLAIFFAFLFVATLFAGPMEALSQRSIRNAHILSGASARAILFAGIWASAALLLFLAALPWRPVPYAVAGICGFAVGALLSALPGTGDKNA
jgi:hypothetical protein